MLTAWGHVDNMKSCWQHEVMLAIWGYVANVMIPSICFTTRDLHPLATHSTHTTTPQASLTFFFFRAKPIYYNPVLFQSVNKICFKLAAYNNQQWTHGDHAWTEDSIIGSWSIVFKYSILGTEIGKLIYPTISWHTGNARGMFHFAIIFVLVWFL